MKRHVAFLGIFLAGMIPVQGATNERIASWTLWGMTPSATLAPATKATAAGGFVASDWSVVSSTGTSFMNSQAGKLGSSDTNTAVYRWKSSVNSSNFPSDYVSWSVSIPNLATSLKSLNLAVYPNSSSSGSQAAGTNLVVKYTLDGGFTLYEAFVSTSLLRTNMNALNIDLSSKANLQNLSGVTVEFRIFSWGGAGISNSKQESMYFYGVSTPYAESGTTPTVSLMGDVTRAKPILNLATSGSSLDENAGEVTATITTDSAFTGATINLMATNYLGANPIQFRDMSGNVITSLAPSSGTTVSFKIRGIPDGVLTGPRPVGVNLSSPSGAYEAPATPLALTVLNATNEVWTNAPIAVINKYVRSLPFTSVNGTGANTNSDIVELLVVGNGQPGSSANLAGLVLKETATNSTADKGYKYVFSSAWNNVPVGTLIVIAGKITNMPIPLVYPSGATNYLIAVSRDDTSLFTRTNTGGDLSTGFSIEGTDMLSLMMSSDANFPVSAVGVNGAMHTIGHGSEIIASNSLYAGLVSGSRTNGYIQKNTNTLSSAVYLQVNNSHGNTANALNDYRSDAELDLVPASVGGLGVANSAGNQAFIDYLRGKVDGTGIATLSGSTGTPIFPQGAVNQTVSITLTGAVRGTAITSASITVPAAFGSVSSAQVSLAGTASSGAQVTISGNNMIFVNNLSLTPDNTLTVNIAGRTIPTPGLGDTGSYLFVVQTSGSGGSMTPLASSPSAVVAVPISRIRLGTPENVDLQTPANPWLPLAEGTKVAVEGVATSGDLDDSGRFSGFLQDASGGIALADAQDYPLFVAGHRYSVYGTVQSDRGLLRIIPEVLNDIGVDPSGIPTPENISFVNIQDEIGTNAVSELWEGKLVCVTNLTKTTGAWSSSTTGLYTNTNTGTVTTNDITLGMRDGNFTTLVLTNGSNVPSTNRIDRTVSIPSASRGWTYSEPPYPISVVAVVSQRSAATNGINNDGYRLIVRNAGDLRIPGIEVRTANSIVSNGVNIYSFTNFNTTYGTAGAQQLFKVYGTNLMSDVSLRPPAGFEISTNGTNWTAWDETVATNDAEGNPVLAYKELVLARAQTNLVLAGTNNMVVSNSCYLRLSARAPGGSYGTNYFTNGRTLKLSTSGFTNYFDIAPSLVTPISQTITFAPFPAKSASDAPFALTNINTSSGLPLVFSSSDSTVASVVGSTLTIKRAGTVTITAVQTGSVSFLPATSQGILTIATEPSGLTNATITLASAAYVYDGSAKGLTPVTTPSNLPCVLTYNGDLTQPTNAGTYTVAAYINGSGYKGTQTATMTINKYPATVTLGSLNQLARTNAGATYAVTVATVPPGLSLNVTYGGSTNLPTSAGNYAVVATVTDANYAGSASGTLQVTAPAPDTLLGSAANVGITPRVIGYNAAHYRINGNAKAWWKYSGVSGVRIFVSPDDIETWNRTSDSVSTLAGFNDQKNLLRSQGTNYGSIVWSQMKDNLATKDLGAGGGNNRLVVGYLLNELRALGIEPLINITASTSSFSTSSWGNKWKMYKHYYAMAYLLGRDYGVQRFQMYNEPDLGGLPDDYLARAQIASQALQDAIADLNSREGKNLRAVVAGPVNAGNAVSDFNAFNKAGSGVGDQVLGNILKKYDDTTDVSFRLFQQWDYHQYGSDPADYASSLASLIGLLDGAANFGGLFPVSVSEFNTHTGSSFDGLTTTLDDEDEAANFGAICVRLLQGGADEMFAFKFGQTESSGSVYGVAKNGIHYVNNDGSANYDTGGITLAGEVYRMFNKACAPGRVLKDFAVDDGTMGSLKMVAAEDPASARRYVFSANNSGSAVTWGLNAAQWGLSNGSPAMVEEASSQENGGVVAYGYVDASGLFNDLTDTNTPTKLYQRSQSVQLYTLAGNTTNGWTNIPAAEDTRIFTSADGSKDGDTTGASSSLLLAKNDPSVAANSNNRTISLIKFHLFRTNAANQVVPIRPGDISMGLLEVDAFQSGYRNAKVQAYVYGTTNNNWRSVQLTTNLDSQEGYPALSWSNCPFVRSAPPGAKLTNRVIQGLTNDTMEILGQIVVRTNNSAGVTKRLDITDFLRRASRSSMMVADPNVGTNYPSITNFSATILVAQEPRWDKNPAVRTVDDDGLGDRQGVGVQIISSKNLLGKGPRLKLVLAKDSDDDGLSDQAETEVYGTNPSNPDQNGNGVPDGMDVLIAGLNVKSGTSVGSANQITFGALPVKNFGDAPFNLSATATGGSVSYVSSNTNVATVEGNSVTIRGAGTTTITARCTGNSTYGPAEPISQLLRVNKARATISVTGGIVMYNGSPRSASVMTTPSGLSTIVTYNGTTVAPSNAGEYVVQATIVDSNYEGSLDYDSTLTTSSLLTILGSAQTITFSSPATVASGSSLALAASSSGGGAITFEIVSGPGTMAGSLLTPTASSGTIVVRATAAATGGFASSSADQSISITAAASGLASWLNGQPTNADTVGKYAIGGATNISGVSEVPTSTVDSTKLSLTAIVRTNDSKLSVVGETGGNLASWSTNGVSRAATASQVNVPSGCQRQTFSVDRTNNPTKQFIRLKATFTP